MKIVKFFTIFILIGLTTLARISQAQECTFQVLATDGTVKYKQAETWLPIEVGQALMASDLLKIEEQAYLGLVHRSGHTLELIQAGTYEVARLSEQLGSHKKEVSAKYAQLYVSSLTGGTAKPVPSPVERSVAADRLTVFLPNSVDVFNDEVIVRWKSDSDIGGQYEVKLKNMFNEVLEVIEVSDTKTKLNFSSENIASERMIIVSVNSKEFKDQKSNDYGMKQLTPEEAAPIARELKELKLEITDEQSALDKLILASFYEQNSLLADALTSYEYAIGLAPDVEAFRTAYEQFIFRNGLDY